MRIGSFLKKAVDISGKKNLPKIDFEVIQNEIGDKFFGLLDSTFADRVSNKENSNLNSEDLQNIVEQYSKQNMAIALASGLVPGPLGIFAAIPELVLTMKNQMAMIYDFSCGFDKESFINKDVLLDIPIFALGGQTNLSALQNQTNLNDSPVTILKEKSLDLGKGIVEKNLKKSLVKFIPVGGALIMATWAKMSTGKIADASKVFFDDNENFTDQKKDLSARIENKMIVEKIKAMINLMETDGDIHENELSFLAPVISNVDIPIEQKTYLLDEAQKVGSQLAIQFDLFDEFPDQVETMMMELCLLAKRDGSVHPSQLSYLFEVAENIKFDQSFLQEILDMKIS